MFEKQNIHFIGIAGIGMSAIAEVLHSKGFKVSGSDLNENNITRRLKKKGIRIFNIHSSKNIKDVDIIVHSSAISSAQSSGFSIINRCIRAMHSGS